MSLSDNGQGRAASAQLDGMGSEGPNHTGSVVLHLVNYRVLESEAVPQLGVGMKEPSCKPGGGPNVYFMYSNTLERQTVWPTE